MGRYANPPERYLPLTPRGAGMAPMPGIGHSDDLVTNQVDSIREADDLEVADLQLNTSRALYAGGLAEGHPGGNAE
jgi:hypothetical protein